MTVVDTMTKVTRRLSAVLVADVHGYSAHMGDDDISTVSALRLTRDIFSNEVKARNGRIVNVAGDSVLAQFQSASDALAAAIKIQHGISGADRAGALERHLRFRIGIHIGDVLEENDQIYGDGVNVAARLQSLVSSGQICISDTVFRMVKKNIDINYNYIGSYQVKNIENPVQAYVIDEERVTNIPDQFISDYPNVTIVVLPFINLSDDIGQEYFADGMVEDLITALSKNKWLYVIARHSSFVYKGRSFDIRQVGRDLNVRYAVEGSVRKSGGHVRISAQLIDALTGAHVWADHFDTELDEVFALQDVVVDRIVAMIEPNVRAVEIAKSRRKPTEDLDAYDLYLRAQVDLVSTDRDASFASAALLRKAVKIDPNYADAWASLGECVYRQTLNGWISDYEVGRAEAYRAAQSAVRAGPSNGFALAVSAWIAVHHGKGVQAAELAERALSAHPNSTFVLAYTAVVFMLNGDIERAVQQLYMVRRLNMLDPRAFMTNIQISQAHFFLKDFETSVEWGRRVIEEMPLYPVAYRYLASALAHLGRLDEAKDIIRRLLEIQPNSCLARSRLQNFPNQWMSELYVGGLKLAGLPENHNS